jgi:hypothetical protein
MGGRGGGEAQEVGGQNKTTCCPLQVSNTLEFARTWGRMKSNRSEEMNYEKMSRDRLDESPFRPKTFLSNLYLQILTDFNPQNNNR